MIDPYSPIVKVVALAVLVAAGLGGAYLKGRSDAAEAAAEQIGSLKTALEGSEATVVTLRQANQRWVKLAEDYRDANDGAVARLGKELAALRRDNARLRKELDDVYRKDPNAAAWAATAVPDAVADRLRQ